MIRTTLAALLAATALTTGASAQSTTTTTPNSATEVVASPAASEVSTEAVEPVESAPLPTAEEAASQAEFLQVQIEALQAQVEALKKAVASSTPAWKGAPELSGDGGWKFKVRGRFQYDVGYVQNPNDRVVASTLGFNSRVRRLRLGVEGAFPGGFLYKAEADLANSTVGYGDVILSYAPAGKFYSVTIGNHDTFQNLEQPSSSRYISFLERAQMVEAFDHTRRLGASFGLVNPAGDLRFNAGIFNDRIRSDNATAGTGEGSYGNSDFLIGSRAVWSPQMFGGVLHVGANYQYRKFQRDQQGLQYRTRPFVQTVDLRFADTGAIAASGDSVMGVELAGIFKSLHVVAEAQQVKVRATNVGGALSPGEVALGTRYNGDPKFRSGYVEAGYFFTGETRGYRNGLWDRTKVLNPFDKGGWGALQINARYDYLDLTDRVASAAVPTAAANFTAPNLVNGGIHEGYLVSLIWQPIDYVRFMAQYTRTEVEGGPRAAVVVPTSTLLPYQRKYDFDVFAMRAQFDF